MILKDITVEENHTGSVLAGTVVPEHKASEAFRLTYAVRGGRQEWLSTRGDAFVAAMLMPAMTFGEDVTVEAPLSPQFLRGVATVAEIYRAWKPELRDVRIVGPRLRAETASDGHGLFFSGGVDSFYSLLKNAETSAAGTEPAISHLLLVFGFDVKLDNPSLFARIASRVETVAATVAKPLVVVETNLRVFTDRLVAWDLYHGGAMASVALAVGGLFRRCTIASSYAYQELHPWGSHPLLDPLWSTEAVELVHDGCEVLRSQKIKRLAASPLALSTLRVCWQNDQHRYNCGRCEKCLRTMLALHAAGALERCTTFEEPLTTKALRRIRVHSEGGVMFLEDVLAALDTSPVDRRLKAAVRYALRVSALRHRLGTLARSCFGPRGTASTLRTLMSRASFRRLNRGHRALESRGWMP